MGIWQSKSQRSLARKRKSQRKSASRRFERCVLRIEQLEERQMLATIGPVLTGIIPNQGGVLVEGDVRNVAPNEITFRFDDGQIIDPATLATGIVITRGGDDRMLGTADDVTIAPGFLGIGETTNEVIMRFASALPDDVYQIDINTTLANTSGYFFDNDRVTAGDQAAQIHFELDLGAQIIAVVPQPVTRDVNGVLQQHKDQIVVYFNDGDLANSTTVTEPRFYKLFQTNDTVTNLDDNQASGGGAILPDTVTYDPVTRAATLTFANDLNLLPDGAGTYRLRIGTDEQLLSAPTTYAPAADPGSSFDVPGAAADDLGTLGDSVVISSDISAGLFPLDMPGAIDEPGHRDIPTVQQHYLDGVTADFVPGITTQAYNFREDYAPGLFNLITPGQEDLVRQIFELYGHYLGIQFQETDNLGFTIVTGDLRVLDPTAIPGPGGILGLGGSGLAIMDANETDWSDEFGGNYFTVAMHEIGHLLGLGHTDELPTLTIMDSDPSLGPNPDPTYPGDNDILHGQYIFKPESTDIDMYRFVLPEDGRLSAETFAERRSNLRASSLDTALALYRENADGSRELIARNDDYFSSDSLIDLDLTAGTYYIGVSSTGNTQYDPSIADSGYGGTTQGQYDLRLTFRKAADDAIVDEGGVALDGDSDGAPGGVYNFWFQATNPGDTLFVDKSSTAAMPDGSLASPYQNINDALAVATAGQIVRIEGNTGADGIYGTADDLAYTIGFNGLNQVLTDGAVMQVPKGVTVMIDAGAVFKLGRSSIQVGSSLGVDRSGAAMQVLGTPQDSVFFTSYRDPTIGSETDSNFQNPVGGDWGGLLFRSDIDQAEERFRWDDEGIFLNYVNHAALTYGGGGVTVDSQPQAVAPIQLAVSRPTLSFNTISKSAVAAISADPNSFLETNFLSPKYQLAGAFTSDYDRIGPDIHGNTLLGNSLNGLFVRVKTTAGATPQALTVAGRFDDTDIVHIIAQNLTVQGTPGGSREELTPPAVGLVTLTTNPTSSTLIAGTYNYRVVEVDADGNEGPASDPTEDITITAGQSIFLNFLPPAQANFVARRIYRSDPTGDPLGPYVLVAEIDSTSPQFLDNGVTDGAPLGGATVGLRARTDARLRIDPGTIVKLSSSRIEVTMGAQLIAEGTADHRVIFTSVLDDKFGAGGTFDTNNDNALGAGEAQPGPGDWAGLYIAPVGTVSIDHALISYGGGYSPIEGTSVGFNAVEIRQASGRIANTTFEFNGSGLGGGGGTRVGRGTNAPGTLYIRGAQPVLLNNIIRDNVAAAITVNANALNWVQVTDFGRSTGLIDDFGNIPEYSGNQGPLVALNRLARNGINGMLVRGSVLTTESVWDDTDIVHVLQDEIIVPDFHTYGGLAAGKQRLGQPGREALGPQRRLHRQRQPVGNRRSHWRQDPGRRPARRPGGAHLAFRRHHRRRLAAGRPGRFRHQQRRRRHLAVAGRLAQHSLQPVQQRPQRRYDHRIRIAQRRGARPQRHGVHAAVPRRLGPRRKVGRRKQPPRLRRARRDFRADRRRRLQFHRQIGHRGLVRYRPQHVLARHRDRTGQLRRHDHLRQQRQLVCRGPRHWAQLAFDRRRQLLAEVALPAARRLHDQSQGRRHARRAARRRRRDRPILHSHSHGQRRQRRQPHQRPIRTAGPAARNPRAGRLDRPLRGYPLRHQRRRGVRATVALAIGRRSFGIPQPSR